MTWELTIRGGRGKFAVCSWQLVSRRALAAVSDNSGRGWFLLVQCFLSVPTGASTLRLRGSFLWLLEDL